MAMARFLVLSDLHLEVAPWQAPKLGPQDFDIAVFAGDIAGSPVRAFDFFQDLPLLNNKPIVYLPGNHEFYGDTIEGRLEEAKQMNLPDRIKMLAPGVAIIHGIRFI